MLSSLYVGGQASALEIEDSVFTAIYPTDRRVLHTAQQAHSDFDWKDPDGAIVSFDSEDSLLDYLRTAEIVRATRISTGINSIERLDLKKDGKRLRAAFREYEHTWSAETAPDGKWHRLYKDSWIYEPAAYELSRLLELDRVPPTTLRRSHGTIGSIQAWVETGWLEADMKVRKIRPPDIGRRLRQLVQRAMFDALINNQDRNDGNSKTDQDWKMWFIDHGRSFLIEPANERIGELIQADGQLLDKTRSVDRDEVAERLDRHLSPAELRFLFLRWDKIVQHFDRLIEERGAALVYYTD
jgi:hypothetical protein